MSIARQLAREFRPLFRLLDEPFGRSSAVSPLTRRYQGHTDSLFSDPFSGLNTLAWPAVDVAEQGHQYILDADLPGVSKENLQVRIGNGNQSITIEGKMTEKWSGVSDATSKTANNDTTTSSEYSDAAKSTSLNTKDEGSTQISVERPYTRNFSFTRTVWLPRPIDPNNVVAKLQNGVLSVTLAKAVDEAIKIIAVE